MRRVYSWGRIVKPVFQGNTLTSFFRHYGHNLVEKHKQKTALYEETLPRTILPKADYREAKQLIRLG
jgi:hypothetical protein